MKRCGLVLALLSCATAARAQEAAPPPPARAEQARAEQVAAEAPKAEAVRQDPAGGPRIAIQTGIVLKVSDRTAASDAAVAKAEELGGYFTERDDEHVLLKVPREHHAALLSAVEALGVVVQRNLSAQDLAASIEEQRTLLGSRQEVLQRYFAVLGQASAETIVTVEREMTRLVQEIENLRGRLRLAEHQLAFAVVVIHFQFRDRRPPIADGGSSFEWLNTVNLSELVQDFRHED